MIQPTEGKQPIILIPGVGGSKLRAIFRDIDNQEIIDVPTDVKKYLKRDSIKTEEMAWIQPNLSVLRNICEYLWDYFDEEDCLTKSILNDYVKIQPIPGLAGCDTMLDINVFKNKTLGIYGYFKPLVILLEQYGYVYGKDLFCYTYDWRQPLTSDQIQKPLQDLIKLCHVKTGKKVIMVGHSLGGQVIDTYIRMHQDFAQDICKFVALAVPFNGSSAKVVQSQTTGYNLNFPIQNVTAKGIQCKCGSAPWMVPYQTSALPTFSQIFIKKLNNTKSNTSVKQELPPETDTYQYITLHPEVYTNSYVPDMCFVVAQKLIKNRSLKQENVIPAMIMLQKCCESGAIEINIPECLSEQSQQDSQQDTLHVKLQKVIKNKADPQIVFEPDFEKNKPSQIDLIRKDFTWESYSFFSQFEKNKIDQQYQFLSNKFIVFDEYGYHKSMRYNQLEKSKAHEFRYSQMKEQLTQYFIAKQYIEESQNSVIPKNLQKNALSCTADLNEDAINNPWQDLHMRKQMTSKSILELNEKMYPEGTLDYELYHTSKIPFQMYDEIKHASIPFKKDDDFRFYSVVGYNVPTGLHLVFQKPVESYTEIPKQAPEYVYVSGDSTVLTTCALGDGYPEFVVAEKLCLENMTHFGILTDERMFKFMVEEVLVLNEQQNYFALISQNQISDKQQEQVQQTEQSQTQNSGKLQDATDAAMRVKKADVFAQFGIQALTQQQIERFEKLTNTKANIYLRRGLYFVQRDFTQILDAYESGRPIYLYNGRGPSSDDLHIGHIIPFQMLAYLQKAFKCVAVIQITDDEKFLRDQNLTYEQIDQYALSNIRDILSCNFDLDNTFIFLNSAFQGYNTRFISTLDKMVTLNQLQHSFGFNQSANIGYITYPVKQIAPAFYQYFHNIFTLDYCKSWYKSVTGKDYIPKKQKKDKQQGKQTAMQSLDVIPEDLQPLCLIPCGYEQDPYWRIARDIASRTKYLQKPAMILNSFIPGLKGIETKMSASDSTSCIYLNDTHNIIKKKINKYAFSGGQVTKEEQERLGANLDVDVSIKFLEVFLQDDDELEDIKQKYKTGKLLTGQVKAKAIDAVSQIIEELQESKKKYESEESVKEQVFGWGRGTNCGVIREQPSLQAYIKEKEQQTKEEVQQSEIVENK